MRNLPVWQLGYEHGWGQRSPRSFSVFYFEKKPTRSEAVAFLRKEGFKYAEEKWFDYGPLTLRETVITIY